LTQLEIKRRPQAPRAERLSVCRSWCRYQAMRAVSASAWVGIAALFYAQGFAPLKNSRVSQTLQFQLSHDRQTNISFLHMNTDREENVAAEHNNNQNNSSEKTILTRKNGNYLEILAISVTVFFLTTVWLSNGKIFSDFSSNYDSLGGKASFYKPVDAESVLQQDFSRESSSVIF